MINPLLQFRSRLRHKEREELDQSRMLTFVIRGFVKSLAIPPSSAPLRRAGPSNLPSTLTVISRLSPRRAGTRFNSRGIDDDGHVANFVETETIFWSPSGVCFSYVQVRGSVPVFWESTSTLLPGQQKIQITRSLEATQLAFDKHFERLALTYGAVHVVNLLSASKPGEAELTDQYNHHIQRSPLRQGGSKNETSEHHLLQQTRFDFHAETKGAGGYEGARAIRSDLERSVDGFAYFMSEEIKEKSGKGPEKQPVCRCTIVLQQEGVFRVNCLDCLDRTNLVQSMISQMALEGFLGHRSEVGSPDFWIRHSTLWADNGDALSKIYAGTGALKSSFTRHGRMSLAGAIADARKSATRLYVNNFADKGRQNTIDLLLGRLMGQAPVSLYDPVNEYVTAELLRREKEFTSSHPIRIWCGTFNLNGRSQGISEDLSPWLCSTFSQSRSDPEIMAVGFQEIVELSPQQIMSTDPARRITWENAVKETLNSDPNKNSSDDYVLLRSGQLVGAALMIFVKPSVLQHIKNVEGAIKKTGMSGIAGNKGAVAIRLEYASTSLCFVTAHLASGFANYEERNRDYMTINHGLRFQKNRSIDNHDSILWFGDFNYRVGLSDDRARRLIRAGDLEALYENDQLHIQMVAGMAFQYYSESRITFPPTYRFDIGTDDYDTSEKARIPAWCDRILRRGNNLRQIDYNTAPLRFSDHRPVFATLECTITVVDEPMKAALSRKLYRKRKVEEGIAHAAVDGTTEEADSNMDEEEGDLMEYQSIAPGLPPASSDRRKWWLDNDKPARSDLQPPREGMVPNPKRALNPFKSEISLEPDWVEVKGPINMEVSSSRSRARTGEKPELPPARRTARNVMASPRDGGRNSIVDLAKDDSDLPRNVSTGLKQRPSPPVSRSPTRSSSASTSTMKKAPPPKPKKPPSLTSPTSQTPTFTVRSTNNLNLQASKSTNPLSQTNPTAMKAPFVQLRLRRVLTSPQEPTRQQQQQQPERSHSQREPQTIDPSHRKLSRTQTLSATYNRGSSNANNSAPSEQESATGSARGALKKCPPPPIPQPQANATKTIHTTNGRLEPKLPPRNNSSYNANATTTTTTRSGEANIAARDTSLPLARGGGEGEEEEEEEGKGERTGHLPPRQVRRRPTHSNYPPRENDNTVAASAIASASPSPARPGAVVAVPEDLMNAQDDNLSSPGLTRWKPLDPERQYHYLALGRG